jgi:hypothetical protein
MSLDGIKWHPVARIEKYGPDVLRDLTHTLGYEPTGDDFTRLAIDPSSITEVEGNQLVTVGLGNLTNLLTGGTSAPVISTARGFVGVGDSSTAWAAGQTDLQASTNKYYNSLATVTRTTTNVTNDAVQCAATTFGTSVANYAWNEWVIGSSTSGTITPGTSFGGGATGAFIYNRKVASMGTKASGASWVFTVTVTFS